jgi:hypothetical protein
LADAGNNFSLALKSETIFRTKLIQPFPKPTPMSFFRVFVCRSLLLCFIFFRGFSLFADAIPPTIQNVHSGNSLLNEGSVKEDLVIKISGLDTALLRQPLYLYVNDKPFAALKAKTQLYHSDQALVFELGKTSDSLWSQFYSFKSTSVPVRMDIGTDKSKLTESTKPNFTLLMSNKWLFIISSIISTLFFAVFLFYVFGKRSMLKDESTAVNKPYSLSRFQLAWWTGIIVIAYIMIYSLKQDLNVITLSAVGLLGISVAATAFARTIDFSQQNNATSRHQDEESEGFMLDLLSDENGISIHRFQSFVFTILFGVFFIYRVVKDCSMPELGTMELGLMGISSGTYVAVKSLENKATPAAALAPDPKAKI